LGLIRYVDIPKLIKAINI